MKYMTVQVVTPDGVRYDHHATYISIRTLDGDMGILPDHVNIIAPLIVHEMKIRRIDDENHVDWVAINGGIIEVRDNFVTIVADSAERERDIDVSRAERAKFVQNVNYKPLRRHMILTKSVVLKLLFAALLIVSMLEVTVRLPTFLG